MSNNGRLLSEMKKTVEQGWRPHWPTNSQFTPLRKGMEIALKTAGDLVGESITLSQGGKFSPQGLREEIRNYAKRVTVPELRRAAFAVERAAIHIDVTRARLTVPKTDRNDVTGALLRGEMRDWLRKIPRADKMAMLLNDKVDEQLLFAAMEVPPEMIGMTHEMRGQVQDHVIGERFGKELAQLEDLKEAAAVTNSAIQIALIELKRATGFQEGKEFDEWIEEASAETDQVLKSDLEADPHKPEFISKSVEQLNSEIEAEFALIWAKAFPSLYPDHPVNKGIKPSV